MSVTRLGIHHCDLPLRYHCIPDAHPGDVVQCDACGRRWYASGYRWLPLRWWHLDVHRHLRRSKRITEAADEPVVPWRESGLDATAERAYGPEERAELDAGRIGFGGHLR